MDSHWPMYATSDSMHITERGGTVILMPEGPAMAIARRASPGGRAKEEL